MHNLISLSFRFPFFVLPFLFLHSLHSLHHLSSFTSFAAVLLLPPLPFSPWFLLLVPPLIAFVFSFSIFFPICTGEHWSRRHGFLPAWGPGRNW